MDKEEKIDELLNDVSNWDKDKLVAFAVDKMEDYYYMLSEEDLEEEYNGNVISRAITTNKISKSNKVCQCNISTLAWSGHDMGCPERKIK